MTILSASRIITAIYYRLLEHFDDSEEVASICVNLDPDIIRKHKGQVIDTIVEDIIAASRELKTKFSDDRAFTMLLVSIRSHCEEDAPIY